jgi:hypothetical protein
MCLIAWLLKLHHLHHVLLDGCDFPHQPLASGPPVRETKGWLAVINHCTSGWGLVDALYAQAYALQLVA